MVSLPSCCGTVYKVQVTFAVYRNFSEINEEEIQVLPLLPILNVELSVTD